MNRQKRRAEAARKRSKPARAGKVTPAPAAVPDTPAERPRILHLHSTFDRGGKELRCVQLINAFGGEVEHTIVSAEPNALAAADLISYEIPVIYPTSFPPLQGRPTPGRLKRLAEAMMPFDLVLTYNWGSMDAVMAHTLFSKAMDLPPLVHHEDGFNEDEANKLKTRRNWYRRIALGRVAALVVPSRRLEDIALTVWQQPRARVQRIPNGIPTDAYSSPARPETLPNLVKHRDERWIGTLAGLRKVKNLPRLVRAAAQLPEEWQLVILGEGPERDTLLALAEELGIEHRVHLPGFVSDPSKVMGLFDVFALSSDSEQFPISVVEAMAAGLPVAATDVGDIRHMVSQENVPFLSKPGDDDAFATVLSALAESLETRQLVGQANRERAHAEYDEERMIKRYRALYGALIGGGRLR